jgi:hypothetical protein
MHHSEPAHPYTHTATVSPPEELGMLTIAGASERVVWGQENLECDLFADVVGAVLASIRRPGVYDTSSRNALVTTVVFWARFTRVVNISTSDW